VAGGKSQCKVGGSRNRKQTLTGIQKSHKHKIAAPSKGHQHTQKNYDRRSKVKLKRLLAKLKQPNSGLSLEDLEDGGGCMSTAPPIDRHRKLCYACYREVEAWSNNRVQPVCEVCSPKIQAGQIPQKHIWTMFSLFTGSSSVMFPLCEQVARSLLKPFVLLYSADSSELSHAVSAGISQTSSIYKAAKANALVYDAATVDVTYLPPCTMGVISPPCQHFSKLGHRQGLADDVTMILHQQLLLLVRLQKFLVLVGEEVLDYFTDAAFIELREVAEECGYHVQWKKLDTKHLNLPTSRPRGFFSMVHKIRTSWDLAAFERNYEAAHIYETGSQLDLSMCTLLRSQYKAYYVTDKQLEKCKATRLKYKEKIAKALEEAGIPLEQARENWYVLDLSVKDYQVVSSSPGIIQCITTVNATKLYCTHKSMQRCFLVQELGIALGFEARPLQIICKALGLQHAGGTSKLGKMLGQCASPACWRVFLGAVIETLKAELFDPSAVSAGQIGGTAPAAKTGDAAPLAPLEMLHNWQMLQKSGQKVWCLHNGAFYRVKVMGVASGGIVQVQYCSDHSFEEVDVGRLSLKTAAAGTMTASAPAAATNTTLVAPATVVAPAAAGISIDFDVKEKVTRLELAQMQEALALSINVTAVAHQQQ
jgi:site-specific DNA-cytosine methylase